MRPARASMGSQELIGNAMASSGRLGRPLAGRIDEVPRRGRPPATVMRQTRLSLAACWAARTRHGARQESASAALPLRGGGCLPAPAKGAEIGTKRENRSRARGARRRAEHGVISGGSASTYARAAVIWKSSCRSHLQLEAKIFGLRRCDLAPEAPIPLPPEGDKAH